MSGSDSFQLLFNEISRQITNINDTLALIGLYYITKTSLKCLLNIYRGVKVYIVSQLFGTDKWLRSMGEWAIVTGASQGIGLAYAKELAKRKFNLILIARHGDKLEKVKLSLGI
jgi:17beta-estradiol 17-dehydrogenase / very-long-chain 3-oxoacyl-CoA reductase